MITGRCMWRSIQQQRYMTCIPFLLGIQHAAPAQAHNCMCQVQIWHCLKWCRRPRADSCGPCKPNLHADMVFLVLVRILGRTLVRTRPKHEEGSGCRFQQSQEESAAHLMQKSMTVSFRNSSLSRRLRSWALTSTASRPASLGYTHLSPCSSQTGTREVKISLPCPWPPSACLLQALCKQDEGPSNRAGLDAIPAASPPSRLCKCTSPIWAARHLDARRSGRPSQYAVSLAGLPQLPGNTLRPLA